MTQPKASPTAHPPYPAIAAYASLASPKEEDPPAPVEAESSETAHSASHSSAEDEPAADLNKAPKAHHFSCGLEVRCPPVHAMCTVLTLALGPRPECSEQGQISRWRLTLALV